MAFGELLVVLRGWGEVWWDVGGQTDLAVAKLGLLQSFRAWGGMGTRNTAVWVRELVPWVTPEHPGHLLFVVSFFFSSFIFF